MRGLYDGCWLGIFFNLICLVYSIFFVRVETVEKYCFLLLCLGGAITTFRSYSFDVVAACIVYMMDAGFASFLI